MTWVRVELARRMLLTVTGASLLASCGSSAKTKSSAGSSAQPVPPGQSDPVRDRALSAEADLLKQYDAVLALTSVTADNRLAAKLQAFRAEHAAHVAAIKQGYTPPTKSSASPASATPSPSATTWSPQPTTDAKTAVTALAGAEQNAASARTADILTADGATAMLLASIAAAESGHAALLLEGTA